MPHPNYAHLMYLVDMYSKYAEAGNVRQMRKYLGKIDSYSRRYEMKLIQKTIQYDTTNITLSNQQQNVTLYTPDTINGNSVTIVEKV